MILAMLKPGEDDEGNNFVDKGNNPVITTPLGSVPGSASELAPGGEEAGVGGVAIRLEDLEGSVAATTATGGSGDCFFENALPGNYALVEEQPDGLASASDFDRGAADENDPGGGGDGTAPSNETPVALLENEDDFGNDFVESRPGRVSGGAAELAPAGEAGVEGVATKLLWALNSAVVTWKHGTGTQSGKGSISGNHKASVKRLAGCLSSHQAWQLQSGRASSHKLKFKLSCDEIQGWELACDARDSTTS